MEKKGHSGLASSQHFLLWDSGSPSRVVLQAGETEACLLRGLKLEGPCDFEQVPSLR